MKVDTVQDDLASARPLLLPPARSRAGPGPGRPLGGGLGGGPALAGRGPGPAGDPPALGAGPSRSAWRPGFVADGPSGPGPRPLGAGPRPDPLNPEAAAGVLQRWIGQGGAPG